MVFSLVENLFLICFDGGKGEKVISKRFQYEKQAVFIDFWPTFLLYFPPHVEKPHARTRNSFYCVRVIENL